MKDGSKNGTRKSGTNKVSELTKVANSALGVIDEVGGGAGGGKRRFSLFCLWCLSFF